MVGHERRGADLHDAPLRPVLVDEDDRVGGLVGVPVHDRAVVAHPLGAHVGDGGRGCCGLAERVAVGPVQDQPGPELDAARAAAETGFPGVEGLVEGGAAGRLAEVA